MKITPTREHAIALITAAEHLNPGPWVSHSFHVAQAAEIIAKHHPDLDPERAWILGCLHDIGRRFGVTDMRHVLDGYFFLMEQGFDDAARISLSHTFPLTDVHSVAGYWDCSEAELEVVRNFLATHTMDEYDRLIQLCDAIALPSGCCLMEKRLMDVAMRRGINQYSIPRWKAYLALQEDFSQVIGQSIYRILPGVVENTFEMGI